MILFIFNIIIILAYIINFDLHKNSYLYTFLWIILIISIFSQFSIQLKRFHKKIVNLQFSISIIIFLFLLIEIAYLINPTLFPKDIRIWVNKEKYNYSKVTEELNESPFVKFKSNTLLRTNFYRGTTDQFSYEWISDKYGFKNKKNIAEKKNFKAIAIGDSFTEGMGVDTDKTYPSLLSKEGISTYNLGVQGYSLSQSLGALKKFGNNFNYEYIILNYNKGTYPREKIINNYEQLQDKKKAREVNEKMFTGGIGDFNYADHNPEIRLQAYFVTSGIWLYTKFIRMNFKNFFKEKIEVSNSIFKPYRNSFFDIENKRSPINLNELSLIEKPILELKKIALERNIKLIVIFSDYKAISYYEKATGKKIPEYVFDEFYFLEKFLKKNDIKLLNLSKILQDYVNELPTNPDGKKLPYLELDGHLNEIGYMLLVQELKKIIN